MRHTRLASVAVLGVLACGGGGGETTNPPNNPPGNPGPTTVNVSVAEYTFNPSSVTIRVGSAVRWSNSGSVSHTVTSNSGAWTSQTLGAGGAYGGGGGEPSYQMTFGSQGSFPYHCSFHSQLGMTGTITVTP